MFSECYYQGFLGQKLDVEIFVKFSNKLAKLVEANFLMSQSGKRKKKKPACLGRKNNLLICY